jgi:hypothetical protein
MKKVSSRVLTSADAPKQFEIATMAVYTLGGAARSIDTEDVAVKCHELAPTLFSWQKHKDQINLELVRVSLSDAKKKKNGGLLSGSGREGWRLTSNGLDWVAGPAKQFIGDIGSTVRDRRSTAGSIDAVRRKREHDRLISSDSWQEWCTSGSITSRAARAIFRIDEYTTAKMTAIKVARIRAMFDDDADLGAFLREAARIVLEDKQNEE